MLAAACITPSLLSLVRCFGPTRRLGSVIIVRIGEQLGFMLDKMLEISQYSNYKICTLQLHFPSLGIPTKIHQKV
ncbi:hypothetical protein M426DRAFT_208219 [Hypoxylon sp. CI-4A]|nr:hypothetical protein M426DRAFT_208219 [Hypoxylon sp. CI-4A]